MQQHLPPFTEDGRNIAGRQTVGSPKYEEEILIRGAQSNRYSMHSTSSSDDNNIENIRNLFGRDFTLSRGPVSGWASGSLTFQRPLGEFSYKVTQKPYECNTYSMEHPLKPILQFMTVYQRLFLVPPDEPMHDEPHPQSVQPQLQRYSISDDSSDWCGSIVLDRS